MFTDLANDGVLVTDYTYPLGTVEDGIDYSNRSFNFFTYSIAKTDNEVTLKSLQRKFLGITLGNR